MVSEIQTMRKLNNPTTTWFTVYFLSVVIKIKIKKPFALLSFGARLLSYLDNLSIDNLSYLDKWIFSTSFPGLFFSSTVVSTVVYFKKDLVLVTLRAFSPFHKFTSQSIQYMKNI